MRNYGRFTTSIYRDEDFRALTAAEQGVYFMLGLQPEITAAGTLSLTVRRWAGMSAGMSRTDLEKHLSVLAERGHVVVDDDTEELLVRKFIKWDGGIENIKRRPVVLEAALAIQSKPIRHAIALELLKLGHRDMASQVCADAIPEGESRFDRVVVTKDELVPQPLTATPNPSPQPTGGEPSALQAVPPLDDLGVEEPGPEPTPYCAKHMPNGPTGNCGNCGDARRNRQNWQRQNAAYTKAFRAAWQRLIDACPDCDEHGRQLDPETKTPVAVCGHNQRRAS